MSIISEALKKANADRHRSAVSGQRMSGGSGARTWASSVLVLTLLILPFALPRVLHRTGVPNGAAGDASFNTQTAARPLADPGSGESGGSGLAQTSVESQNLPMAGGFPAAQPQAGITDLNIARIRPVTSIGGRQLQGIVWTANKGYYAILDNEVVRVGSLVDNLRVTHITPAGVELSDGTETVFIEKAF